MDLLSVAGALLKALKDLPGDKGLPGNKSGGKYKGVRSSKDKGQNDISKLFKVQDPNSAERSRYKAIFEILGDTLKIGKYKPQAEAETLKSAVPLDLGTKVAGSEDKKDGGEKGESKLAGFLGDLKKGAIGLGVLILAIGALAFVLNMFAGISLGTILKAGIALAGVVYAGSVAAKTSGLIKGALGIGALAIALLALVVPLIAFELVKWESIGMAAVAIAGLIFAVSKIKPGMVKDAIGLGALAVALLALVVPLIAFESVKWESLGMAAVALGGLIFIVSKVKPGMIQAAAGVGAMALALLALAIPLLVFESIKWESLGKAASTLVGLVGVTMMATGALKGSAAMIIMAGALWVISTSLEKFQGLDWPTLGIAFAAVAGLAVIAGIMSFAAVPIIIGAAAIGVLGLALVPFGLAINLAAPGIAELSKVLTELAKVPISNLIAIGPALVGIGVGLAAMSGGNLLSNLFNGFGRLFGGEGPLEKLSRLGAAAPEINKLGASLQTLKDVDLDDIEITGDFNIAVTGVDNLTTSVNGLVSAQERAVNMFGQMTTAALKFIGVNKSINLQSSNQSKITQPISKVNNTFIEQTSSPITEIKEKFLKSNTITKIIKPEPITVEVEVNNTGDSDDAKTNTGVATPTLNNFTMSDDIVEINKEQVKLLSQIRDGISQLVQKPAAESGGTTNIVNTMKERMAQKVSTGMSDLGNSFGGISL
jgi:hypothetical protein